MIDSARKANAKKTAYGKYTLPRDWLAGLFALVLLLFTYDAMKATDGPLVFASALLLGAALYRRAWKIVPCALLFVYMFTTARYYPHWVWKIPAASFFVPLALGALTCLPFATLRSGFRWLRMGRLDQVTGFLVILTSLVSALALILWALWTDYLGVAMHMLAPLKEAPRWFSLLVLVPGFALVNAAAEEAVYRGVILDALEETFGARSGLVLGLQASAFAAAHYQTGFPNGNIGYLMTFIYALMLGWLRRRTDGMLAPYVAHVTADAVIGFTLVLLAS